MVRDFKKKMQDPSVIRDMQYELFQQGQLIPAEDIRKDVDKLRAAMDASPSFYHVSGLPRHTASLADALMRKKWHTVDAPAGKSFLISDCPVMTAELNGNRVAPGAGFGKGKRGGTGSPHVAEDFCGVPARPGLEAGGGADGGR